MYRVLIPIILFVLQPILPGWTQDIPGGDSGSGAGITAPVPPAPPVLPMVPDSPAEAEQIITATTPARLFDALGQIDDGLKNLDDLKELADHLRRTAPGTELEIRQLQTRLNQQRQKLEEKRAELEILGAKLRGQAKALRAQQEEMSHQTGFPPEAPEPGMMPGYMGGMGGGGMMGGMGMGEGMPMPGMMGMGMGGMMGGGRPSGNTPAQPDEMDMQAIPLKVPVPENMLQMVNPLLQPDGSFSYDSRNHILIMRGRPDALKKAILFMKELTDTYAEALEKRGVDPMAAMQTVESVVEEETPQTIQIEALLLEGEKVPAATAEVNASALPPEAVAIGLQPDDLKPFGKMELIAVGPMVLQSMLHPDRGSEIRTRLGEYSLRLAFQGQSAMVDLRWADRGGENQPLLSNMISTNPLDRPILVGSVNPDQKSTVILVIRFKRI